MAIKSMNPAPLRNKSMNSTRALDGDMTADEFKEWIKCFDADRDGRISREELRRAIRVVRGRFSGWKSRWGVRAADSNGDGYINEDEIDNLIEFAEQSLGLRIVAY